jgi:hypothetical protein
MTINDVHYILYTIQLSLLVLLFFIFRGWMVDQHLYVLAICQGPFQIIKYLLNFLSSSSNFLILIVQ